MSQDEFLLQGIYYNPTESGKRKRELLDLPRDTIYSKNAAFQSTQGDKAKIVNNQNNKQNCLAGFTTNLPKRKWFQDIQGKIGLLGYVNSPYVNVQQILGNKNPSTTNIFAGTGGKVNNLVTRVGEVLPYAILTPEQGEYADTNVGLYPFNTHLDPTDPLSIQFTRSLFEAQNNRMALVASMTKERKKQMDLTDINQRNRQYFNVETIANKKAEEVNQQIRVFREANVGTEDMLDMAPPIPINPLTNNLGSDPSGNLHYDGSDDSTSDDDNDDDEGASRRATPCPGGTPCTITTRMGNTRSNTRGRDISSSAATPRQRFQAPRINYGNTVVQYATPNHNLFRGNLARTAAGDSPALITGARELDFGEIHSGTSRTPDSGLTQNPMTIRTNPTRTQGRSVSFHFPSSREVTEQDIHSTPMRPNRLFSGTTGTETQTEEVLPSRGPTQHYINSESPFNTPQRVSTSSRGRSTPISHLIRDNNEEFRENERSVGQLTRTLAERDDITPRHRNLIMTERSRIADRNISIIRQNRDNALASARRGRR